MEIGGICMSLGELQAKRTKLKDNTDITLRNMEKIANESYRVAEVAHNSRELLDGLEQEFEAQVGLNGNDIKFLFAAIGLQVARIVILNEITKVKKAGIGNKNETELHEFQKKLLGKFNSEETIKERPYYASMEHIITKVGVPYDATAVLTEKSIKTMLDKDRTWDFSLDSLIPTDNLQLFKGANHRFATLGHDPILGLIFGTANIMTNTISCVKTPVIAESIGIPILTTNHVVFASDYKDPRIATYASTAIMLKEAIERTKQQPSAFVASLIKQIIHIGTDLYTPCGIQIPAANLLLSNTKVEELTRFVSTGDLLKIDISVGLAELINLLISTLHTLTYDVSTLKSREIHNVKTRKIIMYSDLIASASNVLWVGGNLLAGNSTTIRQLDIGGLLVTVKHLISDTEYIRKIKEEFVLGGFNKLIQGDDLNLEIIKWD